MSPHRPALAVALLAAVAVATAAPAGAAAATTGPLDRYLVSPSVINAGTAPVIADGRSLSADTLNGLCGFTFASEKERTARVQVGLGAKTNAAASQEVVSYKSSTTDAHGELAEVATRCAKVQTLTNGNGDTETDQLSKVKLTGLLPGSFAFADHIHRNVGNRTIDSIEVYQFKGKIMSAIYVFDTKSKTLAARTALAQKLARAAAAKL